MNLKINPQVYEDLLEIKNYIAEDDAKEAEKVIDAILTDIGRLLDFPESGLKLSNKLRFHVKYRYILTYSYATIYYISNEDIRVITVIHTARDFSALKF